MYTIWRHLKEKTRMEMKQNSIQLCGTPPTPLKLPCAVLSLPLQSHQKTATRRGSAGAGLTPHDQVQSHMNSWKTLGPGGA